jgi:homoserine kinase type II
MRAGPPKGEPMAVYTEVPDTELQTFIAQYDIGEVASCKGIAEGVENSNFLIHTSAGSYILTLYEKRVRREDRFLGLMDHLAAKGLDCPTPSTAATDRRCANCAAGRRRS